MSDHTIGALTRDAARLDAKARRAAKRVGLIARKSTWCKNSADNLGGFMLIEPHTNCCVAGYRFELSAEDVIDCCTATAKKS